MGFVILWNLSEYRHLKICITFLLLDQQENNIVNGIRTGNEQTFRELFNTYYPRLTLFAVKYIRNQEVAEEIVQDFFVRLYEKRTEIVFHSSVQAYFYQSIRNSCLNKIKQKKVRQEYHRNMQQKDQDMEPDASDRINETELENYIFRIVSGFPRQQQKIYRMSREKGMKNREIAEELNISVRTVETQISRTLKILREKLSSILEFLIFIALLLFR